jgi:hypothetical protein
VLPLPAAAEFVPVSKMPPPDPVAFTCAALRRTPEKVAAVVVPTIVIALLEVLAVVTSAPIKIP